MTTEQQQIRAALVMAQELCHKRFCDLHPLGQSEVCKTTLEAIALLDSQAAEGGGMSALLGYEQGFADAATAMRSRCVEKVKAKQSELEERARLAGDYETNEKFCAAVASLHEVALELEAVTLEQQQEKQG